MAKIERRIKATKEAFEARKLPAKTATEVRKSAKERDAAFALSLIEKPKKRDTLTDRIDHEDTRDLSIEERRVVSKFRAEVDKLKLTDKELQEVKEAEHLEGKLGTIKDKFRHHQYNGGYVRTLYEMRNPNEAEAHKNMGLNESLKYQESAVLNKKLDSFLQKEFGTLALVESDLTKSQPDLKPALAILDALLKVARADQSKYGGIFSIQKVEELEEAKQELLVVMKRVGELGKAIRSLKKKRDLEGAIHTEFRDAEKAYYAHVVKGGKLDDDAKQSARYAAEENMNRFQRELNDIGRILRNKFGDTTSQRRYQTSSIWDSEHRFAGSVK